MQQNIGSIYENIVFDMFIGKVCEFQEERKNGGEEGERKKEREGKGREGRKLGGKRGNKKWLINKSVKINLNFTYSLANFVTLSYLTSKSGKMTSWSLV